MTSTTFLSLIFAIPVGAWSRPASFVPPRRPCKGVSSQNGERQPLKTPVIEEEEQQAIRLKELMEASVAAAERYDAERRRSLIVAGIGLWCGRMGVTMFELIGLAKICDRSSAWCPYAALIIGWRGRIVLGSNDPVALLHEMERSPPLALRNGGQQWWTSTQTVEIVALWRHDC